MSSETYRVTPSTAVANARLAFRRLVAGALTDLAAPVEVPSPGGGAPTNCVGFALDRNGNPSYVLLNNTSGLTYTVNQWDGTAWQTVGPNAGTLPQASDGRGCSSPPDLAFNAANQPIVGYEGSGQFIGESVALFVQRFDGTAWQGLGPNSGRVTPLFPSNPLFAHSMKLDSTDTPVVEWNTGGNTNPGHVSFVVRFAASPTPALVGVGPNGGQLPATPTAPGLTADYHQGARLVLDANDRPLVASGVLVDSPTGVVGVVGGVAAFKFDGTQWAVSDVHQANAAGSVELGSKAPVGAFVDGAGQLRVAWTEIADRNIG